MDLGNTQKRVETLTFNNTVIGTTKTTSGEKLAISVLPFMTSKHTESKQNCINMVAKPIDRHLAQKDIAIKAAMEFVITRKTQLGGLTFRENINPISFVEKLKTFLEE